MLTFFTGENEEMDATEDDGDEDTGGTVDTSAIQDEDIVASLVSKGRCSKNCLGKWTGEYLYPHMNVKL